MATRLKTLEWATWILIAALVLFIVVAGLYFTGTI
jgi:hypothetical protein